MVELPRQFCFQHIFEKQVRKSSTVIRPVRFAAFRFLAFDPESSPRFVGRLNQRTCKPRATMPSRITGDVERSITTVGQ